jgi:hypothetical protein
MECKLLQEAATARGTVNVPGECAPTWAFAGGLQELPVRLPARGRLVVVMFRNKD